MSEASDRPGVTAEELERAIRGLKDAIQGSRDDLASMPVLVRPMIRRGFARRTGRSFDEWDRVAASLLARVQQGTSTRERLVSGHGPLEQQLERLAESYQSAPERAARFIRNQDTLRVVRERAAARAQAVRALIGSLRALPA